MPPRFTTLPREIRDAILEMCLVVGVIDPHSAWGYMEPFKRSTRKPDISLLAVNKAINAEAAEIFYGKNVWVIIRPSKHHGPREWDTRALEDEIWHIHRNQIRHVRISLDPNELEFDLWSLAGRKAYRKALEKTPPSAPVENAHMHGQPLLIDAWRWKLNICRELGIKSLTIDLPPIPRCFAREPFLLTAVIWRGCLQPLVNWARSDEETRVGEPNPTPVRSYPEVKMIGCPDTMRVVCEGWKDEGWKDYGDLLNHFMNDDRHCLEGFFQPRDAQTNGKT